MFNNKKNKIEKLEEAIIQFKSSIDSQEKRIETLIREKEKLQIELRKTCKHYWVEEKRYNQFNGVSTSKWACRDCGISQDEYNENK